MPTVSIVMPFRNASSTLSPCLESIQNQTLEDFELIAVNDGSEDSSPDFFRTTDPRVHLHEPGRIGFVAALNYGIAHCRAPLIARMDADDLMHPERLEQQITRMDANSEAAVTGCLVALFPADQIRKGYSEYIRWQNTCVTPAQIASDIYVESPYAHPSVMFRREAWNRLGGYREGPFPEDYDLWLRMFSSGYVLTKVPKILLYWRERSDRLSRVDPRYSREAFDNLRADYLARDSRIQNASEIVIWGAGRVTRNRAQHLLQQGIRISAWIDIDPRKIGKMLGGHRVYSPDWLDRSPHPMVLIYVTNHGAREEISGKLEQMGYLGGKDYLAVG